MRLRAAGVLLGCVVTLVGCRPLYVPPIPASMQAEERVTLGKETTLSVEGQGFIVAIALARVPSAGWLSVQWFDPAGRQVAADSTWIAPGDEGLRRQLIAPPTVVPEPGRWWAIVSFDGGLLRQVFAVVMEEN